MAADAVIAGVAESREVSGHGLKRRESFDSAAELALVVASLHADAAVWTGEVDSAAIVFAEKLAPLTTIEEHRHAVLGDLLDHLVHALPGVVAIRVDQPWLAEDVKFIAFDEEMPLAARSALIAFVLWHCRIVARGRASASRRHRKSPVDSTGRPERRQAQ